MRACIRPLTVVVIMLAGVAAAPSVGQCRYEVHVITGPECAIFNVQINALGMNRDGDVVGLMLCPEDDGDTAFIAYGGQTVEPLDFPWPAPDSRAYDINDRDEIVGTVIRPGYGNRAFFRCADGVTVDLGTMPGGNLSSALGVNAHGHVVGYWANVIKGPVHAFAWFGGEMIDIGPDVGPGSSHAEDINDHGQVTGWQAPNGGMRRAFLWQDGRSIDLAAQTKAASSWGYAINNLAHVVGRAFNRAALWRDGQYIDLGLLPGTSSTFARDINELDQVVGNAEFSSPAFLWQKGVMLNLNDLVDAPDNIELDIGDAINDAGVIACRGRWPGPPNTSISVVLTPIGRPPSDVDGDCRTDADDLQYILRAWGARDPFADIDGSGTVGFGDLLMVLANWDVA